MASLRIEVKGELGRIMFRAFLAAAHSALGMLSDYDIALSDVPGGSLDWAITRFSTGSLVVETESRSRIEDKNVGPAVARSFVRGWLQIEGEGVTPPYLSESGMRKAKRLVRLIGREGVTGFTITDFSETVEVTPQASAHSASIAWLCRGKAGDYLGSRATALCCLPEPNWQGCDLPGFARGAS
ncbi:MAG: hypothetical protein ACR2PL_17515 [Dehalococcoidia bacterium]